MMELEERIRIADPAADLTGSLLHLRNGALLPVDISVREPKYVHRRRHGLGYAAVVVLVGGVLAVSGLAIAGSFGPPPRRGTSALDRSLLNSAIEQAAVDYAAESGDGPATSVTWVRTNMQAAVDMFNRGANADSDAPGGPDVYAVVITGGPFVLGDVPRPQGASAPSGTVLDVIFSTEMLGWAGGGISSDANYDLSVLGAPVTDSVSGVAPMSVAQFERKFGTFLRSLARPT